jgi:hypothetical protein
MAQLAEKTIAIMEKGLHQLAQQGQPKASPRRVFNEWLGKSAFAGGRCGTTRGNRGLDDASITPGA